MSGGEREEIRVSNVTHDEKGDRLEPEAVPAERVVIGEAALLHGGNPIDGGVKTETVIASTAGALAATVRNPCKACKHFDRRGWIDFVKQSSATADGKQFLNQVMGELIANQHMEFQELHTNPLDGDFDTVHALNSLGLCRVLTEMMNDAVIVHPIAVCPPQLRSPDRPQGAFEPFNKDADREGSAAYDAVLRVAQFKPK